MKKIRIIWKTIIIVSILFLISYIRWPWSKKEYIVKESPVKYNKQGEFIEISLKYMGQVAAGDEESFGYSKESLENNTFWWQLREEQHLEYYKERFKLSIINMDMDFERYYYIISYGRPLACLYCDTSIWYNYNSGGYGSSFDFDMEIPYKSNVVYVYQMDKVMLSDIEWG